MKAPVLARLAVAALLVSAFNSGCSSGSTSSASTFPVRPGNTAITAPGTAYPLKVSANRRYLVDQNDLPFLMIGDSPQSLIVNLSPSEAESYFANRAVAGFNTVWINLLCNTYTGGRADGSTFDGILPFNSPGDLTTPNEAYFSRAGQMITLAGKYGLTVMLDPIETGGWLTTLLGNGTSAARGFGRYLGTRYRSFDNIIWMSGNDFQEWNVPANDAVVQAVALGIRDADSRHLHTTELNYKVSGSLDDSSWAPIIQLDSAYTYYPTYARVLNEYNRPQFLPVFMVEANYEYENLTGNDPSRPLLLRKQEYWTMLSGAAGQFYGNHYTWTFIDGWQSFLDSPGAHQLAYLKALFKPLRWYDLQPDQNHFLLTSGYGTFSSTGSVTANDYATAALTADGSLAVIYLPSGRTFTVDLSRLAGRVTARWYDPTSGTCQDTPGSPFLNTVPRQFTTPGNNSEGSSDWVLVLSTS